MCLQCVVNAKMIGDKPIFGNYYLMKSQKENEDWDKDYYGLVLCNDPLFVWNMNDVKEDNLLEILYTDPYNGYLLYKTAIESGYDKNKHFGFKNWFQNKVVCFIEENEI